MHPQRTTETLAETRQRLQRQIFAVRKTRDTYAAYGSSEHADQLLDEITRLEIQLQQTHKPGRKPSEGEQQ